MGIAIRIGGLAVGSSGSSYQTRTPSLFTELIDGIPISMIKRVRTKDAVEEYIVDLKLTDTGFAGTEDIDFEMICGWIDIGGAEYWVPIPLPQKLILTPAVVLDEMDATTGWGKGQYATLAANTTEFMSGVASLKVTSTLDTNGQIVKSFSPALDLSGSNGLSFRVRAYTHSVPADTIGSFILVAGPDGTMANYFSMSFTAADFQQNKWRDITPRYNRAWGVGAGAPNWNNIGYISIKVGKKTGTVSQVSYDLISTGPIVKPAVMLTFDDGSDSVYNIAYPLMKARNMVGTAYIISDYIGSAGYMTAAQLQELNANGWDIGNHTSDHTNLTTLTQAEAETKMNDCKVALDALGLTRASSHVAYPYGTGFNETVRAAITHWGGKTGRVASGVPYYNIPDDVYWPYEITDKGPMPTTLLAEMTGYIDNCILWQGSPIVCGFHKIVASGTPDDSWLTSLFTDFLDYIVTNNIQSITIDECFRLYSGAITVNHK